MSESKYLYVLFSSTPYRMGRMIRFITREPYNHVSIALEENLTALYAFARRYYRTPFYGGFVSESPSRYHHRSRTASVSLYRVRVSEAQWLSIKERIDGMESCSQRYLYNHLSAMAAPLHRKVSIRDAYTCAEFAVSVLHSAGIGLDPKRFYTIGQIRDTLEGCHVYSGLFPVPPVHNDTFFLPHPVSHPIFHSTKDLLRLIHRRVNP